MLTTYYARENINKDRFLFDRIGETLSQIAKRRLSIINSTKSSDKDTSSAGRGNSIPEKVLLIVPEQFTLQAERNAFEYLDASGFIDLDVLSTSSLNRRLNSEKGREHGEFINQYGKYMLIAKLLYSKKKELITFRGLENSSDFAQKLNDVISELKMFGVSPEDLLFVAESLSEDDILGRKLRDVATIFAGYQEYISSDLLGDSLRDAADQIKDITSMISTSDFISKSEIWITGFDYFSPSMKDMIVELSNKALSVGMILTADIEDGEFTLTNSLIKELNAKYIEIEDVDGRYIQHRPEEISFIEQNLFSIKKKKKEIFQPKSTIKKDNENPPLIFVESANCYSEAETAAARIAELIRDQGYRYKDILILCNDLEQRGEVIKRVFAEYGLPVFIDQRRNISHNPVLEFILSLPDIIAGGRKHEDVFRLLKTGLTEINREEFEELENYALRYKIRGKLWDKEFHYGKKETDDFGNVTGEYSEEEINSLNKSRQHVFSLLEFFEKSYKRASTAKEKSESILSFIKDYAKLPEKIEMLIHDLSDTGFPEYAAEMSAVWDVVENIFNQMITILGDLKMSHVEYSTVLRMGFDAIRIGMLPTGKDQIVLGTMQRTRSGDAEAIFVLGMNEGVLPAFTGNDGILSEEEKLRLEEKDTFVGRLDETIIMEEQLAIYRNLSKAKKMLYLSYSISDTTGKDIRPSMILKQIKKMFPNIELLTESVIFAENEGLSHIQAPDESIVHLTDEAISAVSENNPKIKNYFADTWTWLITNGEYKDRLKMIRKGLNYINKKEKVNTETIISLLNNSNTLPMINTSPSSLENFSKCPFSWFLKKGLKLSERRIYELDNRNVGDIYHKVLMQYGRDMCGKENSVNASDSKWSSVTLDECKSLINEIFDDVSSNYNDGLLESGLYEKYKSERIVNVLSDVAWAITEQVRDGNVNEMRFESTFNFKGDFPPIVFHTQEGTVNIRGQIDRLDVLEEGYALITDYKSGNDEFRISDVKSGWQLQLMTYLAAISENYTPAGVNYFKINEKRTEDKGQDIEAEIRKKYNPDGYFIDDPTIKSSTGFDVLKPVQKETFDELRLTVNDILLELCEEMIGGNIHVSPKTSSQNSFAGEKITACTYCNYSGICNYDIIFN